LPSSTAFAVSTELRSVLAVTDVPADGPAFPPASSPAEEPGHAGHDHLERRLPGRATALDIFRLDVHPGAAGGPVETAVGGIRLDGIG